MPKPPYEYPATETDWFMFYTSISKFPAVMFFYEEEPPTLLFVSKSDETEVCLAIQPHLETYMQVTADCLRKPFIFRNPHKPTTAGFSFILRGKKVSVVPLDFVLTFHL